MTFFKVISLLFFALLSACSFQQPQNAWQYKAVTAFEKYQDYYLENRAILADSERKKAINFAKQSAHLNTLARVYLGDCAIQFAALNKSDCSAYQKVAPLIDDPELSAYFHLLSGQLSQTDISQLPENYRGFARTLLQKSTARLQDEILLIPELTSRLIAASIAKPSLNLNIIRTLIDQTALRGYQLASIRWMTYLAEITPDPHESQQLKDKIALMTQLN